ncbi:MAG TPA: hypothetical protein DDW52_29710, partial [Planctomycetaceae bacterium]|nr:hypothetical protein [Planctomycetaceae bacterium]
MRCVAERGNEILSDSALVASEKTRLAHDANDGPIVSSEQISKNCRAPWTFAGKNSHCIRRVKSRELCGCSLFIFPSDNHTNFQFKVFKRRMTMKQILARLRSLTARRKQDSRRLLRRQLTKSFENLEHRRVLAAGVLDPSFGEAGIVTTDIGAVVSSDDNAETVSIQQPDGKVLVAGRVYSRSHGSGFAVTRYNGDGSLDEDFGDSGTSFQTGRNISTVYGMDLQSDGRIVVAGNNRIVRLDAEGDLDNSFGTNGILVTSTTIQDIKVVTNNQIVIGGYLYVDSEARSEFAVAKYESDGSELNTTFGEQGITAFGFGNNHDDYGRDLEIASDGSIFVAGSTYDRTNSSLSTNGDFAAIKLDSDGNVVWSFRHDGGERSEQAYASAIDSENRLLLAGYSGSNSFSTLRVTSTGNLDLAFGGGIVETNFSGGSSYANSVVTDSSGSVFVSGYAYQQSTDYDFAVVKFLEDGSLDADFGESGTARIDIFGDYDYARDIALQDDGRIVIAGTAYNPKGIRYRGDFATVRLMPSGELDNSFGDSGIVTTDIKPTPPSDDFGEAISTQQPDGKLLVAGRVYADGTSGFAITRHLADGSIDETFGVEGKAFFNVLGIDNVEGLALQSDGKILVAGYHHIARLTPDGASDAEFGIEGILNTQFTIQDLTVTANNKIVIGGNSYIDSVSRNDLYVAQYLADGSGLDTAFGVDGVRTFEFASNHEDYGRDLAIGSDGSIFLGGSTRDRSNTRASTYGDYAAIKLDSAGQVVWAYRGDGGQRYEDIQSVDVDSENRLVMATSSNTNDFQVMRLTANGDLDTTFGSGLASADFASEDYSTADYVSSVIVDSENNVFVAGSSNQQTTSNDFAVAKFLVDGTLDQNFNGNGKQTIDFAGGSETLNGILVQADGSIVLAGTAYNTNNRSYDFALARLTGTGDLDAAFDQDGTLLQDIRPNFSPPTNDVGEAISLQQPDGKILVAGRVYGRYVSGFAVTRYHGDGTLDESFGDAGKAYFDGNLISSVSGMDLQSDGKIVVAGFSRIARIDTDGSLDTSFGSNGYVYSPATIQGIKIVADNKIIVGGNRYIDSTSRSDFVVTRYLSDGSDLDTTFGDQGVATFGFADNHDENAYDLAIGNDGSIFLGGQVYDRSDSSATTYGDFAAIKLTADGSVVWSFRHDGGERYERIEAIDADNQNRLLLAGDGRNNDFNVMRLTEEGDLDLSFGGGVVVTDFAGDNDIAQTVLVDSTGQVLVGGSSANTSTRMDFALAKFLSDGTLDSNFGDSGQVTVDISGSNDYVRGIAEQADGKIVIAGYAEDPNATSYRNDIALTRLLINNVPVASDVNVSTDEDSSVASVSLTFTDADLGDTHTFEFDTSETLGLVINNGDGTFNYDPNGQYEWLPVGETAADTFSYTVADNEGASSTATVTVTIVGTNDSPTASLGVANVQQARDSAQVVFELGDAADIDSESLRYSFALSTDALASDFESANELAVAEFSFEAGFTGTVYGAVIDQDNGRNVYALNVIVGTRDADTLTGTSSNDLIIGLGKNDTINAANGSDFVFGGGGDDTIDGGKHRDFIDAGDGNDVIQVRDNWAEFDTLAGGGGFDTVVNTDASRDIRFNQFLSTGNDWDLEKLDAKGRKVLSNSGPNTLDFRDVQMVGVAGVYAQGGNDTVLASD